MSYFTDKSQVIYSDFQASLTNGSEIDSGWLDMSQVDKVQFSGYASTLGLTMTIESRADPAQTPLITPITYNDSTFYMFNVICRQKEMRFRWTNNTGATVTNVSMEIKETFGSSDKMSVFPLGVNPTNFSQAALVQSVIRGQQPNGDYVSVPADGTAFSSSITLSSDGIYQSEWINTDGWSDFQLFVSTDVESAVDGFVVEYTDDVQAITPTVRATQLYQYKQEDIDRGFLRLNLEPFLDGCRVRYTNGSLPQSSFFIDGELRISSQPNNRNKAGALVVADYTTEIALGNVQNFQIDTKFGRNPDIDSGPEDMWNGGSNYTGQPENYTPETVDVFSSSANDTSAGTGARTIRFFGLESPTSEEYTHEDITLNGTTAVTSTKTWWRINRAFVLTAGSGGENVGTITIEPTTSSSNVFVQMLATFNQSTIGAYTVPANKIMIIKRVRVAITRANGSAGSATITLRARETGGVYRALRVFEMQTGATTEFTSLGGIVLPEGTDIKYRIETVSDTNTVAEGSFEYILVNVD